ncbi:MAG: hypothetical protein ACOCX7_00920, partial [Bacteroidota bacterium]
MKIIISIIVNFFFVCALFAQVENVPVTHPVYEYLLRAETRGFLPHYSLADLPLERRRIVSALKMIDERRSSLSNAESRTLDAFMEDFDILPGNNYVIIPSKTDSSQLIFGGLITDREKYIYHYHLNTNPVSKYC